VGTGAGTIAIGLAVALRRRHASEEVDILATDISADALALALENAVGQSVADRITFAEADLFPAGAGPFDLVLGNLPYIPSGDVPGLPVAASFEPVVALDGGPDGMSIISRLLERLPDVLAADGLALLEIGSDQETTVIALAARLLPGWPVSLELDLGSAPRVLRIARR
jgi:release factor glutamine methyltransferase